MRRCSQDSTRTRAAAGSSFQSTVTFPGNTSTYSSSPSYPTSTTGEQQPTSVPVPVLIGMIIPPANANSSVRGRAGSVSSVTSTNSSNVENHAPPPPPPSPASSYDDGTRANLFDTLTEGSYYSSDSESTLSTPSHYNGSAF